MQITVADESVRGLDLTPEQARLELAIGLFSAERVTLGRAAEIAGISQSEVLMELGRRQIPIHYHVEDYRQDLKTLRESSLL